MRAISNHLKKKFMLYRMDRQPAQIFLAVITIVFCILFGTGCVKSKMAKATASLDVIHTVVGAGNLRPSFREEGHNLFQYSRNISYNTFLPANNRFGSYTGNTRLRLYELLDTTAKDQPLFDLQLDLPESSINTLLLTGTKEEPETLLIRETIPYFHDTDSVMAIRFINSSPGSGAVNIQLQGGSAIAGLSGLAFKQHSNFITFPVLSTTKDYVFEARDATTGKLLTTYKTNGMNTNLHGNFRYRSFTLILGGVAGETGVNKPVFILLPHFK